MFALPGHQPVVVKELSLSYFRERKETLLHPQPNQHEGPIPADSVSFDLLTVHTESRVIPSDPKIGPPGFGPERG